MGGFNAPPYDLPGIIRAKVFRGMVRLFSPRGGARLDELDATPVDYDDFIATLTECDEGRPARMCL